MSRYIITVNRDAIDKGTLDHPIRVEDTRTGTVREHATVWMGPSKIVTGIGRAGARVWIEADSVSACRYCRADQPGKRYCAIHNPCGPVVWYE